MKNNSPKKSKQPTPSNSKKDIVKNKKLKPLENSSKKTLDAKHFLKSNTSSESDMELDSTSASKNIPKSREKPKRPPDKNCS
ncbi:hypothetical protein AVEN_32556-1 [Araneus ventricosus]|uniref:Uncharacterized protein n=1 Tax=Araneus ventricosus TaxID=182803 RepID=A0A4Y2L3D5_ARAVE|nr:hypothetical protein AVEN_32556-1 [Araneus ventricosus]